MAASEILPRRDPALQPSESAPIECLSDEELLAFANGTLRSSRQAEAHFHFDRCEVCQRLLSEAAHALAMAVTVPLPESAELSWHTTFRTGTLVGQRYLIRRFIARGGMGEVYEAFDRDLQERVALKTVTSTACDNESAVRRLKAEVQLARRVSHPNVCRIYDFGTHLMPDTGAQLSFLTMEFVDGETLGQRVRLAGALPVAEARELGRQLLAGLSAAHQAGVLHRDFKSDNVMLREDTGAPLILDFGLARALEEGSRNPSASAPNLLGTFGYIAPEQLLGQPHSTASDVYSFGVVWFEMLTGELPFGSGASPLATALARLQRPASPPSAKNPLVPSDLDAIVLGCLRRTPQDRFRTASEALAALDALDARSRTAFRTRKLLPLALAAMLGGVAAGTVAAIPPSPNPIAETTTRIVPPAVVTAQTWMREPETLTTEGAAEFPSATDAAKPKNQPRDGRKISPRAGATPTSGGSKLDPIPGHSRDTRVPGAPAADKGGWENPFGASTANGAPASTDGGS